jgi:thiamine biosynthesis lipoprotein
MFFKELKRGKGAAFLLVFLLVGCEQTEVVQSVYRVDYRDSTMGTRFTIKIPQLPDNVESQALKHSIKLRLDELDSQFSTYKADSEISRINAQGSGDWISVTPSFGKVMTEALRINKLSQGAFDPTIGPLVNLWGFGPDPSMTEVPDRETIKNLLLVTGTENILWDSERLRVKKLKENIFLDFSALAKGYAVDEVARLLENQKINDFMVEIGGELRLKGVNSTGDFWRIAVEKPTIDQRMIQQVLAVSDSGIASSGDYRNYFEKEGARYSHTIDPGTGYSIKHAVVSVTVLHDSTMTADAFATTFMVLGEEKGLELAKEQNLSVLFILKTDEGFVERSTSQYQLIEQVH